MDKVFLQRGFGVQRSVILHAPDEKPQDQELYTKSTLFRTERSRDHVLNTTRSQPQFLAAGTGHVKPVCRSWLQRTPDRSSDCSAGCPAERELTGKRGKSHSHKEDFECVTSVLTATALGWYFSGGANWSPVTKRRRPILTPSSYVYTSLWRTRKYNLLFAPCHPHPVLQRETSSPGYPDHG